MIALAQAIGISPAIVSDPVASKPVAEVQDLINRLSLKATKAQDLAMASAASQDGRETQILTAASLKKLDDDIRTVHANAVLASDDARDNEGWMRWKHMDHRKDILELKIKMDAITEIMMQNANDAQKAKVSTSALFSSPAPWFHPGFHQTRIGLTFRIDCRGQCGMQAHEGRRGPQVHGGGPTDGRGRGRGTQR